jgi:hypothetical protein
MSKGQLLSTRRTGFEVPDNAKFPSWAGMLANLLISTVPNRPRPPITGDFTKRPGIFYVLDLLLLVYSNLEQAKE